MFTTPSMFYAEVANATLSFNGKTIPLFAEGGSAIGGSVSITPYRYWEFDPNDGDGPIYDKFTGARIRTDI